MLLGMTVIYEYVVWSHCNKKLQAEICPPEIYLVMLTCTCWISTFSYIEMFRAILFSVFCNLVFKYVTYFHLMFTNRIRYLLLGRVLRLTRILLQVQRFRAFVATFFTLMSSLLPYLGIVFCVLCMYCSLGLQVGIFAY